MQAALTDAQEGHATEAAKVVERDATIEQLKAQFEAMTAALTDAQEDHAAEVAKVVERDATIEQLKSQIAELTASAPKTDAKK